MVFGLLDGKQRTVLMEMLLSLPFQFILRCQKGEKDLHITRIAANGESLNTSTHHKTVLLRGVSIVWGLPYSVSATKATEENAWHYLANIYFRMKLFRAGNGKKYERDEGKGWDWDWDENAKDPRKIMLFFRVFFSTNMEKWSPKIHTASIFL